MTIKQLLLLSSEPIMPDDIFPAGFRAYMEDLRTARLILTYGYFAKNDGPDRLTVVVAKGARLNRDIYPAEWDNVPVYYEEMNLPHAL